MLEALVARGFTEGRGSGVQFARKGPDRHGHEWFSDGAASGFARGATAGSNNCTCVGAMSFDNPQPRALWAAIYRVGVSGWM